MPQPYKANERLGNWVATQRRQYKLYNQGKKAKISPERIAKLDEIGFEWDASHYITQANDKAWETRLAALIKYKEKHGDFNVPRKHKANKQLGNWVATQRRQYNLHNQGKKAKISLERIAKLNEIGFEWDASHKAAAQHDEGAWEARLAELIKYKEKHGDFNVPRKHKANKQLGNWVAAQRHQCKLHNQGKKAKTSPERIAKLNKVGFNW